MSEPRRRGGRIRNRLLPRTVLGLATMVLAFAVGAAFSGAVLYSYYDYRLTKTTDKFNAFIGGYQKQFTNAKGDLNAQTAAAKAEIDKELGPLRQLQASSDTLQALVKKVGPSMYFVHTLDPNGQPSVGSAFVVASNPNQSLLLTSYTTVAAATRKPGPDLFVRQGGADTKVTVWTWDERYDLALIVLAKGNLPVLAPAPTTPPPTVGDRVFAVSGLGSLGAAAVQGVVTDVSGSGHRAHRRHRPGLPRRPAGQLRRPGRRRRLTQLSAAQLRQRRGLVRAVPPVGVRQGPDLPGRHHLRPAWRPAHRLTGHAARNAADTASPASVAGPAGVDRSRACRSDSAPPCSPAVRSSSVAPGPGPRGGAARPGTGPRAECRAGCAGRRDRWSAGGRFDLVGGRLDRRRLAEVGGGTPASAWQHEVVPGLRPGWCRRRPGRRP